MPLMKPTIHLNGTSGDYLENSYREAASAVERALRMVMESYPNGRDFYPQGPDALAVAMQQHNARVVKLKEVRAELHEILEDIDEQQDARKR